MENDFKNLNAGVHLGKRFQVTLQSEADSNAAWSVTALPPGIRLDFVEFRRREPGRVDQIFTFAPLEDWEDDRKICFEMTDRRDPTRRFPDCRPVAVRVDHLPPSLQSDCFENNFIPLSELLRDENGEWPEIEFLYGTAADETTSDVEPSAARRHRTATVRPKPGQWFTVNLQYESDSVERWALEWLPPGIFLDDAEKRRSGEDPELGNQAFHFVVLRPWTGPPEVIHFRLVRGFNRLGEIDEYRTAAVTVELRTDDGTETDEFCYIRFRDPPPRGALSPDGLIQEMLYGTMANFDEDPE